MKKLIAFYSRAGENYTSSGLADLKVGNTQVVAEKLKELTGADIFKIEQVNKYSKDYYTCTQEAQRDQKMNARPNLKHYLESIDDYDEIYLCYPNFWGTMPMAVWTFLENYDFSNKIIKPLCTHEGSGMGRSESDIKKLCPNAKIESGLAIRGSSVQFCDSKLKNWI